MVWTLLISIIILIGCGAWILSGYSMTDLRCDWYRISRRWGVHNIIAILCVLGVLVALFIQVGGLG